MWKCLICAAMAWMTLTPAWSETVLNVAASADLVTLDPTGTASTNVYTHGFLVYDTLFAPDENLQIHKQMVGDEAVSADKLTYTLTLRPGLLFHDGSKVTTADVIASLQRWMRLDIVGRTMAIDVQSMTAIDPRTFTITLKRPFPVEQALANSGSGLPVILRQSEASGGPFTRGTPVIGSGPFRFVTDEWVPGDRAVYTRFDGYVPRDEPADGLAGDGVPGDPRRLYQVRRLRSARRTADGLAGGKVAKVDRIVFHVIPDAATKSGALQTGEVDFIDRCSLTRPRCWRNSPGITVAMLTKIYNPFFIRPNALYPPVRQRQGSAGRWLWRSTARDYMQVAFVRPEWGQPCPVVFRLRQSERHHRRLRRVRPSRPGPRPANC